MSKWQNDNFEAIERAAEEIMTDHEIEGDPITFERAMDLAYMDVLDRQIVAANQLREDLS